MQSGFIKQQKVEHSWQYHKVIEFIHMHMRDRNTWQEQANRLICINDFKWRKREAANYLRGKVFCVFSVAVSWSMLPIWKVENLFQFTLCYMDLKCLKKNISLKMIYFDLFVWKKLRKEKKIVHSVLRRVPSLNISNIDKIYIFNTRNYEGITWYSQFFPL